MCQLFSYFFSEFPNPLDNILGLSSIGLYFWIKVILEMWKACFSDLFFLRPIKFKKWHLIYFSRTNLLATHPISIIITIPTTKIKAVVICWALIFCQVLLHLVSSHFNPHDKWEWAMSWAKTLKYEVSCLRKVAQKLVMPSLELDWLVHSHYF